MPDADANAEEPASEAASLYPASHSATAALIIATFTQTFIANNIIIKCMNSWRNCRLYLVHLVLLCFCDIVVAVGRAGVLSLLVHPPASKRLTLLSSYLRRNSVTRTLSLTCAAEIATPRLTVTVFTVRVIIATIILAIIIIVIVVITVVIAATLFRN